MKEIFLTTENIKQDYSILKILNIHHPYSFTKSRFGKDMSADETVQALLEILKQQAADLGADGIIGLRIETFSNAGAMAAGHSYNIYGTAIKLKE